MVVVVVLDWARCRSTYAAAGIGVAQRPRPNVRASHLQVPSAIQPQLLLVIRFRLLQLFFDSSNASSGLRPRGREMLVTWVGFFRRRVCRARHEVLSTIQLRTTVALLWPLNRILVFALLFLSSQIPSNLSRGTGLAVETTSACVDSSPPIPVQGRATLSLNDSSATRSSSPRVERDAGPVDKYCSVLSLLETE